MKRVGNTEEDDTSMKRRKLDSGLDAVSKKVEMKYSEKMDLKKTFGLKVEKDQLISRDGSKLLFLLITKNSKIRKQLDKILRSLDSKCGNLLMVGQGDGIQKMVTIIEILKQKLKQLQKVGAESDVANNMIAKTEDLDVVKLQGQIHERKYEYNYNQLNFLDFTVKERQNVVKNIEIEGSYNKDIIDEELKVKKLISSPVLYVYMTFHSDEKNSEDIAKKIDSLVSTGWSLQKC